MAKHPSGIGSVLREIEGERFTPHPFSSKNKILCSCGQYRETPEHRTKVPHDYSLSCGALKLLIGRLALHPRWHSK
jgi:hypothetical protein